MALGQRQTGQDTTAPQCRSHAKAPFDRARGLLLAESTILNLGNNNFAAGTMTANVMTSNYEPALAAPAPTCDGLLVKWLLKRQPQSVATPCPSPTTTNATKFSMAAFGDAGTDTNDCGANVTADLRVAWATPRIC
jgi:hypothetical protein